MFAMMLAAVIAFNLLFPVIALGKGIEILFYFVYSAVLGGCAYTINDRPVARRAAIVLALFTFGLGVAVVLLPFQLWISVLWGLCLVGLQAVLIFGLLRSIFSARHVSADVLIAGVTIYLLLGTIYVPIYTQLEVAFPGSFAMNTAMSDVGYASLLWTRFLYFSYMTLTTLGYGDITPLTGVTQALAVSEAIIGVLYIAVLMARLVGVYSADIQQSEP